MNQVWKHIEKTNEEMGDIQKDVATIKTDICWLKRFMVVDIGVLISLLVLVIKKINGGI